MRTSVCVLCLWSIDVGKDLSISHSDLKVEFRGVFFQSLAIYNQKCTHNPALRKKHHWPVVTVRPSWLRSLTS